MKIQLLIILFLNMYCICHALKGLAQLTYYESYARCCKNNPNYNPSVPTTECDLYSAW